MDNQVVSGIPAHGVDVHALSSLIIDLNISRRNSRTYPKGHQVIDAALNKVLATYAGLKETGDEVVIGVACDALLLGDTPLEKSNLIFRDFARVLYERGIGALVLHRGLTIVELRRFITILGARREQIYAAGGIESVWEKSGIASIEIRAIRYDLFTSTEEARSGDGDPALPPKGIWERFAWGLVNGLLTPGGLAEASLDPELLAEVLNEQFLNAEGAEPGATMDVAQYLRQNDIYQGAEQVESHQAQLAYRKLADFVGKLTPGLRRQFLSSAFDIKKISSESQSEGLIRQLSSEVVIGALEDINQGQLSVPPFVLGLLQQMSSLSQSPAQSLQEISDQELHDKMRTIFKEHAMEEFIPDTYQDKLNRMMSAEQIPLLGLEGVQDLMDSFDAANLESRTSDILLLLLRSGDSSEEGFAALAKNLQDIGTFFLQTGDYGQLLKILHQLAGDEMPVEARQGLLELFASPEFMEEVLDGLHIWGKAKFDEISEVIGEIGVPFVGVLLERLAGTESMSLRRFLMDRLVQFGDAAAPAIMERLSDGRWYFLRNLIGVIRQAGLTCTVEKLRTLGGHSDQRVSQEALKALLEFHDPEAEARLMRDLESQNRELLLAAVRIAGKSGSAALLGRLHAMLAASGLSGKEYEVKSLVVQALGEIGNVASLPVLERVLASRSIWHPVLSGKLKLDVVGSLGRYPAAASRPLLARLAGERGKLARQAAQVVRATWGGAL